MLLTVSSPGNLQRTEEIKQRHREAIDGGEPAQGPVVVWQGFSVHGNEPSGANAALLLAYHMAAAQGPASQPSA